MNKEPDTKKEYKPKTKTQLLASSYYARKDIQKAMYDFCKNRETVANFNNEFFAKRPDCFDYPTDIAIAARKGATSFHCSEELWEDPLKINTNMTPDEYNEIKIGWDFLIDIDSKYLDYSKIAAKLLIKELEAHGVHNYGIKFSGSKGFHIIVPFKAFPHRFRDEQTKNQFPKWPRIIAEYLFNRIKEPMHQEILKLTSKEKLEAKGELISESICPRCKKPAEKKLLTVYKCPACKTSMQSVVTKRKKMECPSCNEFMNVVREEETIYCKECKTHSKLLSIEEQNKLVREIFENKDTTKSAEDSVDFVLVASRHLFRAPYSLHEKTGFASIVLTKEEIDDFKPTDANPLKITQTRSYLPPVNDGEATKLLFESLDNTKKEEPKIRKYEGDGIDLQGIKITEDMFPPIIKKLNKGLKGDGRKRALNILLSFYNSLEFPPEYIEEEIDTWNKKNKVPLKLGYVKTQVLWHEKNKRLPPNYDKPVYKEFGITSPPEPGLKNPINYTIRKALQKKGRQQAQK